jgi:hypothetical protein
MKKNTVLHLLSILMIASLFSVGCNKHDSYQAPPIVAHFTNRTGGDLVVALGTRFAVPVGVTLPSSAARTVSYTITSPTGAVAGTHYNISGTIGSLPLAPNRVVDSLIVTAVASQYAGTSRIDTLVIAIRSNGDFGPADYNATYRLVLKATCDINPAQLVGAYTRTLEQPGLASQYGPYTTTVSTPTTNANGTSGTIRIANIYDDGWAAVTANINWANPAAPTITIPLQATGRTYGGVAAFVRTTVGAPNTVRFPCALLSQLDFFIDITDAAGNPVIASGYRVRMDR